VTFCLLTELVLNATVILYLEKLTFETAPADTFAFLMITTGFIVVVDDVELLVADVVDVEDVRYVEVDVVEDVVEEDVDEVEDVIVSSMTPPDPLPPGAPPTVVATVVVVVVDVVVVVTGADIVIVAVFMLFSVVGVVALSVTNTFAAMVFPASAEGIVHENVFVVPATPVKSIFVTSAPVMVLTTW